MLQIIVESQEIEVGRDCGNAYSDYLLEYDYVLAGVDLRDYIGPRAKWAEGADVILCNPEGIAQIFQPEAPNVCYTRAFKWADYCKYIQSNIAA